MPGKTLNVLCVCQNGVGSSVMLRVFVEKVLDSLGVTDRKVEINDASTVGGMAQNCDVIITSAEVADIVRKYGKPVISLVNMTSKKEIAEKLSKYLEETGG